MSIFRFFLKKREAVVFMKEIPRAICPHCGKESIGWALPQLVGARIECGYCGRWFRLLAA